MIGREIPSSLSSGCSSVLLHEISVTKLDYLTGS